MIVVELSDRIETSYSGYKKLIEFYNACRDYTNETIHINFYNLEWIDGNQCALLDAIFYKLSKENGLSFSTDFEFLKSKFDVLFRNGFIKTDEVIVDTKQSTVPAKSFSCSDKNGFVDYIENHLLKHRGMPELSDSLKEKIIEDLIEVFCNSHHHANTKEPFFVAGQYYPKSKVLKFTMVDLGDGFLPRINKATDGLVETSLKAIEWALQGNSSKLKLEKTSGGLGIKGMYEYCMKQGGTLDIITGNGFWSTSHHGTIFEDGREIECSTLEGSTINLVFKQ